MDHAAVLARYDRQLRAGARPDGPGARVERAGGVVLHLGIEDGFRPARKAHPGIRVSGIEAFAGRLAAHGARVDWDDTLPGHARFYSQDPVGNRLEFLEPLPG
jgi:hypothetical protein